VVPSSGVTSRSAASHITSATAMRARDQRIEALGILGAHLDGGVLACFGHGGGQHLDVIGVHRAQPFADQDELDRDFEDL